jgi:hypothetical protein
MTRKSLFLIVAVMWIAPAAAADGLLVLANPDGSFHETFDGERAVSGETLVGLAFGAPGGTFDPSEIRLLNFGSNIAGLCVQMRSRDARYRSINAFRIDPPDAATLRFANAASFGRQLSSYAADDIAIRAVETTECSETARGVILPASLTAAPSTSTLVVFLNVNAVSIGVSLRHDDDEVAVSNACREPKGSRTAYNVLCTLDLPAGLAPAIYLLDIAAVARTGRRESIPPYRVRLGSLPPAQ